MEQALAVEKSAARPARVLLISRPLRIGAYQRKAELLARDERFALTVAVPARWREDGMERPVDRAHTAGYELVALPIVLPGRFHLYAYRGLGALIDRLRPDLIHIDEEAYNVAAYLAIRAALTSPRREHSAALTSPRTTNTAAQSDRRPPKTIFFTWQNLRRRYPPPFSIFERTMFARADGAIAGSTSAAEVLRAKGYAGPLWTVPQFGVDAARFHPPTVPRQRDVGRLRVGYAGRLVPEKGLDVLVEAVARIGKPDRPAAAPPTGPGSSPITLGVPGPGVTLELIGDGPERERLAALAAERGLGDRIRFTPHLASTEMPAFYQRIDALVLPSRTTRAWKEQFGRVLIEAMACGAVCVGSDSGEIPNVIGSAGVVVPEGDAAALAGALARLAAQPAERAALGEAGRSRVLERYTMEAIARATADVWAEVLRS